MHYFVLWVEYVSFGLLSVFIVIFSPLVPEYLWRDICPSWVLLFCNRSGSLPPPASCSALAVWGGWWSCCCYWRADWLAREPAHKEQGFGGTAMLNPFSFLPILRTRGGKAHLCVSSLDGSCECLHAVDALCGVAESGLNAHVTSGSLLLHVCILNTFRETGNTVESL